MNLNKLIKEEYNSILNENYDYEPINFDIENNTPEVVIHILKNHILRALINISNKILNLPIEKRHNLNTVKQTLEFIKIIEYDIKLIRDNIKVHESNEEMYDIIDNLMIDVDNYYDDIYRLFDALDSIIMSIDDAFGDYEWESKKYR